MERMGRGCGYLNTMDKKLLGIYLNDHLAGSVTGVELARRARGSNEHTELGDFLATVVNDIEDDRRSLMDIMDQLGIRKDPAKRALAWVTEKAGRLKPNGQITGYSPLSRLIELEGLTLGVTGKLALWKALRRLSDSETQLDSAVLDRLIERAEEQQGALEERRLAAAQEALGAPAPAVAPGPRVASGADGMDARAR